MHKRPRKTSLPQFISSFQVLPTDCWQYLLEFLKENPGPLAQTCSQAHAQVWAWRQERNLTLNQHFLSAPDGPAVRAVQRHLAEAKSLLCVADDAAANRVFPFARNVRDLVLEGAVSAPLMRAVEDGCGATLTKLYLLSDEDGIDARALAPGVGKTVRGDRFPVLQHLGVWQCNTSLNAEDLEGFASIETLHTLDLSCVPVNLTSPTGTWHHVRVLDIDAPAAPEDVMDAFLSGFPNAKLLEE